MYRIQHLPGRARAPDPATRLGAPDRCPRLPDTRSRGVPSPVPSLDTRRRSSPSHVGRTRSPAARDTWTGPSGHRRHGPRSCGPCGMPSEGAQPCTRGGGSRCAALPERENRKGQRERSFGTGSCRLVGGREPVWGERARRAAGTRPADLERAAGVISAERRATVAPPCALDPPRACGVPARRQEACGRQRPEAAEP